jgi:hypothetical protein
MFKIQKLYNFLKLFNFEKSVKFEKRKKQKRKPENWGKPAQKKKRLEIGPEYFKMFPKPEKPETYNSYWAGPLDQRGVRQVEIHHNERRLGITVMHNEKSFQQKQTDLSITLFFPTVWLYMFVYSVNK